MKRTLLIFIIFVTSINLCYCVDDNNFNKTLTDITYESFQRYINDNKSTSFESSRGLKFFFTDDEGLQGLDVDYDLFGLYQNIGEGRIYVNLERINNFYNEDNNSLNSTLIKIENTLMHELGHYIDHKDRIPDIYDIFNVEVENDIIQNRQYFIDLEYEYIRNNPNTTIPQILQDTVSFPDLYSGSWGYNSTQHDEETMVRLFALCWGEKDNYTYYWEMFEARDYDICEVFSYPAYMDNNLNKVGEEVIEGYIETYDTAYTFEKDSYTIRTLITNGFGTLRIIISETIDLILNNIVPLSILTLIVSFIVYVIQLLYLRFKDFFTIFK